MNREGFNSTLLIILLLTSLLLGVKNYAPYLFYLPTFFILKLQMYIADRIRMSILEELEEGIVASRKHVLYWRLIKSLRKTDEEILRGIKGEDMKAQVAGSSVDYTPVADGNRNDEKPFSVTMKKLTRDQVNEHAGDRINLDKSGRVKNIREQAVRYANTISQISGWKNLTDESGNQIKFNPANKKECYDMLPINIQEELEMVFGNGGFDASVVDRIVRSERKRMMEDAEEDADYQAYLAMKGQESKPKSETSAAPYNDTAD